MLHVFSLMYSTSASLATADIPSVDLEEEECNDIMFVKSPMLLNLRKGSRSFSNRIVRFLRENPLSIAVIMDVASDSICA